MTEIADKEQSRLDNEHIIEKEKSIYPDRTSWIIFLAIFVVGFALDLWSKSAVFNAIHSRGGYSIEVIDGVLQFIMAENAGAAFGLAAGKRFMLTLVSFIALIASFYVFSRSGRERRITHIAFGLFAGGVAGNLYDRVFNDGFVRDFIDIVYWPGKHWPAFNVADSLLVISVGLFIIAAFTDRRDQKRDLQQKSEPS